MTERESSSEGVAHPSAVLSAFVESLVAGRRVAVFGEITGGLPELLAERGARLVCGYDADRSAVAEALARGGAHRVSYAVLEADLDVRDGAFDVVVIPDLSCAEAPGELVRLARRLLARGGTLVAAAPNPDLDERLLPWSLAEEREHIGYYDLYDLVSLHFPEVRMLGQAPFVGYTIADFAPEGDLDITVDTSLLEATESPEWFIAVAGERRVEVESYAVIGLPLSSVQRALVPASEPTTLRPAPPPGADRIALTEAQTKLAVLSAEIDKLRERERDAARESRSRGESATLLSSRVVELEGQLSRQSEALHAAEARAREAEERVYAAESKLAGAELRAERAEAEARRAQVKLAEDDDRAITQRPPPLDDVPTPPTLDSTLPASSSVETGQARDTSAAREDELERLVSELTAKNGRLEERLEGLRRKSTSLEQRVERLTRELEAARASLDDERARRASLEQSFADRDAEIQRLERALEAPQSDDKDEEISRLEDSLRERGHAIVRLEEELRESERVGRELVEQLELSGAFRGLFAEALVDAGAPRRADDQELRARLAVLTEVAAKAEADLTQASWRVSQLERQVELAERDRSAAVVNAELEEALLAARQEIAALRTSVEGSGVASPRAALVEQSVLLSQVAGELEKGASD